MKFSEEWLREWIDIKIDSSMLYKHISDSGIELESVKKFEPIFHGVVVGEIIQCISHTILNKLKVIKVDIGKKKTLNIVCGAPNCRTGIKVAVATVGSILPKGIIINKKMFKGVLSEGMLCSFFELSMFTSDKIIEFAKNTPIGINVNDVLLLKDNIIKVSTTSNRPDGLSILGIARNIASINNTKILPFENKSVSITTSKKIDINIQAKNECMSYVGRIISNININVDTPFWMKKKLFFSDLLSENIITNIINYVLIEIGQPLNILNADNIHERIIVRMACNKEKIVLKKNTEITLDENILVFSDSNQILFLPGNINSYTVDINKHTNNIFLSSYLINQKMISNISKKIGFNKILEYHNYGIDPLLQNYALEYATNLIVEICSGVSGPITNEIINSFSSINNAIRVYHSKFNKIIGFFVDSTIISNILYNLDYKLVFQKDFWDVTPPSWRFDILIEEDVISDIIRIYGYKNIFLNPLKEHLNCSEYTQKNELNSILLDKSRTILVNQGYYEVINYSFVNPNIQSILFSNKKQLLISNPISQDMSSMRLSLWPGLLKNVTYNKNRQQQSMRFFESGLCFLINSNCDIKQEMFLAAIVSGNYVEEKWYCTKREIDFYDLKGDLESILESICNFDDIEFRRETISGLHPKQSASIYFKDILIGSIGKIDPRLENKLNVNSSTFLFEISLNDFSYIDPPKIQEISKFPTIRRDIAILLSEDIAFSAVINQCKKFFIDIKVEINLFDIYSKKELTGDKKSLGISFIFQHEKRTLEDNEINLMINNCIEVLKKEFQVILRK